MTVAEGAASVDEGKGACGRAAAYLSSPGSLGAMPMTTLASPGCGVAGAGAADGRRRARLMLMLRSSWVCWDDMMMKLQARAAAYLLPVEG